MPSPLTLQATSFPAAEWLFPIGAVLLLVAAALTLALRNPGPGGWTALGLAGRAGRSLERLTGIAAWSCAGIALQGWALLVAGLGLYWDVAWHIDLGRDAELFTPPHVLILVGLAGFALAGAASVAYATLARAAVGWRLGSLRVPRGSAALIALGVTAAIGFPLDDLWHAMYGVDVTMWSPTHLMMIGAGALSPFAAWILWAEAGPPARRTRAGRALGFHLALTCLLALSVLQLEFDDGVPQWQALYQPVLIAVAATLPMVTARIVLGRGRALAMALAFLAVRSGLALVIGPELGHVVPHFPLYVGIAACVELAFASSGRVGIPAAAALAGGLAGSAGLATEWGFSQVFGREPWQASMLSMMWLPLLAAVAAALLGAAFGLALLGRRIVLPRLLPVASALALLAALLVPLPRTGVPLTATATTTPAGPRLIAVDRYGQASMFQEVRVEVDVDPGVSAWLRGADWFWVTCWQGGGRLSQPLRQLAPGRWIAPRPLPTGAAWKTVVMLARGDVVAAIPVSLPADPALRLPAIPVEASRTQRFVPATRYLTRESHGGAPWLSIVVYLAWLSSVALWLALLVLGARGLVPRRSPQAPHPAAIAKLGERRLVPRAPLHLSR